MATPLVFSLGDERAFFYMLSPSDREVGCDTSYSSHDSCKSLGEELSDYYGGRHRSHPRPHPHRREKERKPYDANINLPYFHGKDNVEAYLDWEMKVEQLFACHHTSEERKVPLATLSFQGYTLY